MNSSLKKGLLATFVQMIDDFKDQKEIETFLKDFFDEEELEKYIKRISIAYWIKKGRDDENIKRYIKYIIRDSYFIKSQEEALEYISEYIIHIIKDEKKINYVSQVVENELLPHMGIFATIKEKCFFLGHMVNKLLRTSIGTRKEDDRDNYANKRVEMTGVLFCDLFRTLFKRFVKSIEMQIEKKKQRPDILSIISRTNSITTGLRTCVVHGLYLNRIMFERECHKYYQD